MCGKGQQEFETDNEPKGSQECNKKSLSSGRSQASKRTGSETESPILGISSQVVGVQMNPFFIII